MSEGEFEFILAALEFLAIYGQRFLALYQFNWKTGSWAFDKKALKGLLRKENDSNIHLLPVASALRAVNFEHYTSKESNDEQLKDIKKYAAYLEAAKNVASLLPKFPPQLRVPKDVDVNLVHFKV